MSHLEYLLKQHARIWDNLIDSRVNEDLEQEKLLELNLQLIENQIQREKTRNDKIS